MTPKLKVLPKLEDDANYKRAASEVDGPAQRLKLYRSRLADAQRLDPSTVAARRRQREVVAALLGKILAAEDALTVAHQTQITPAKAAFMERHAPAVAEAVWRPAMQRAAAAWLAYQREFHALTHLAGELHAAGFWGGPINFPSKFPSPTIDGDPADPTKPAHEVAGELVREGYLTARDVAGK